MPFKKSLSECFFKSNVCFCKCVSGKEIVHFNFDMRNYPTKWEGVMLGFTGQGRVIGKCTNKQPEDYIDENNDRHLDWLLRGLEKPNEKNCFTYNCNDPACVFYPVSKKFSILVSFHKCTFVKEFYVEIL